MNHRERLVICSSCTNRKLDFEHGYVCKLTGKLADFKDVCKDYQLDETASDTIKIRTKDRPFVPLFDPVPPPEQTETKKKAVKKKAASKKKLSKVALKKLGRYQSFLYALLGGLLFTVAASMGWAFISAVTGYQEAYLAIGLGFLVGLAVRYFGAGIRRIFGFLAALFALAGSVLGNYLSQAGFPEELQLAAMIKVPSYLSADLMVNTLRETFVLTDLLFYGLSALLAYLLAIRRVNSSKMAKLERDSYKGAPALHWLRLPLVLGLILLPGYYAYTLTNQQPAGYNTLYYDSGVKMSEGKMLSGLEIGEWTSWHENGNIRNIGSYDGGRKDSLWKWYDESGILTGTGMYDDGVENGTWINYYPDGVVSDSGSYREGLKEGLWKYYHENGNLMYAVPYKAGKMHGEKILLSSSGAVVKVERFEDGILIETPQ